MVMNKFVQKVNVVANMFQDLECCDNHKTQPENINVIRRKHGLSIIETFAEIPIDEPINFLEDDKLPFKTTTSKLSKVTTRQSTKRSAEKKELEKPTGKIFS